MKNKNLYIFDFGDTLVSYPLDTWDRQITFVSNFFKTYAYDNDLELADNDPLVLAERLNQEREDGQTVDFVERLQSTNYFRSGLSLSDAAAVERQIISEVCQQAILYPDAHPGIAALRASGNKIGIMSNLPWGTRSSIWLKEFARHGFIKGYTVDEIVCCVDVGYRKPAPFGIQRIMDNLDSPAESVVFVGDNPKSDYDAARAARVEFIFISRGHSDIQKDVRRVSSLTEL